MASYNRKDIEFMLKCIPEEMPKDVCKKQKFCVVINMTLLALDSKLIRDKLCVVHLLPNLTPNLFVAVR